MATIRRVALVVVIAALAFGAAVALSFLVDLPIAAAEDFYQLYASDLAVRYGVGLYDEAAQAALYARVQGLPPESVRAFPWVYPPWYNLATFYLAWMPIREASRLWFYLNFAMLGGGVVLLTAGWPRRRQLAALVAALLFVPSIAVLFIGQLIAPAFLGACACAAGLRRARPGMAGLGLILLSFKPPAGVLIALAGVAWLVTRRRPWSRRALGVALVGGLVLVAGAFALDPTWPADYLGSLLRLGGLEVPALCDSCSSLSQVLARRLTDSASGPWIVSGVLAAAIVGVTLWGRHPLWKSGPALIAAAVLLTLLVSPYVRNYDYVMLLVPLMLTVESARGLPAALVIAAAYFIPWLTLIFPGRPGGSEFLWGSAALLLALSGRWASASPAAAEEA